MGMTSPFNSKLILMEGLPSTGKSTNSQKYVNIKSAEWLTPKPLTIGSKIAFKAQFLGRELSYVYEIIELDQGMVPFQWKQFILGMLLMKIKRG
jgi:hypothetical protein